MNVIWLTLLFELSRSDECAEICDLTPGACSTNKSFCTPGRICDRLFWLKPYADDPRAPFCSEDVLGERCGGSGLQVRCSTARNVVSVLSLGGPAVTAASLTSTAEAPRNLELTGDLEKVLEREGLLALAKEALAKNSITSISDLEKLSIPGTTAASLSAILADPKPLESFGLNKIWDALRLSRGVARHESDGKTIVIDPSERHTATVFMLHGETKLDDEFTQLAKVLSFKMPHVKWIFPYPPSVTHWFKVTGGKGMAEAADDLRERISQEAELVSHARIVLVGFCHAGTLAAYISTTHKATIGGVIIVNGYFPCYGEIPMTENGKEAPIYHLHGIDDKFIPYSNVLALQDQAVADGVANYQVVGLHSSAHTVSPEQIEKATEKLETWIPKI